MTLAHIHCKVRVCATIKKSDMTDAEKYTDRLAKLYCERGISVPQTSGTKFKCQYAHSCCVAQGQEKLCWGAEAHIGERYGDPIRIVFASLDTGDNAKISSFGLSDDDKKQAVKKYLRRWDNDGINAIVIVSPHPSAPGPWSKFRGGDKESALETVCQVIRKKLLPQLDRSFPI